ncbi:transposase (plasmid) [Microbulbifer spongiae]|uniref:Transposase n=2 Tax=Microbulbifer spongiae TaxID=2944933 RepID=A0ABY9EGM4_9GAMM|nr:transposase [Microbulbifer sp. MI-G]WKD51685.1 transposase [Microbulbifer sp. MI-G]
MKIHIGIDSKTKPIYYTVATSANVHDSVVLGELMHAEESHVWGDSTYASKADTIAEYAMEAIEPSTAPIKRTQLNFLPSDK